jgi:hypothetical protein
VWCENQDSGHVQQWSCFKAKSCTIGFKEGMISVSKNVNTLRMVIGFGRAESTGHPEERYCAEMVRMKA